MWRLVYGATAVRLAPYHERVAPRAYLMLTSPKYCERARISLPPLLLLAHTDAMLTSGDVALRMVSACNMNDWHVAESLLDLYGPEVVHVRGIGEYDSTPLHAAAATGQLPLLHLLLRSGAMVDAPALHAFTPLFMAVRNNRPAAASLLLAAGADPDALCAGTTPLLVAADAGFAAVCAALLKGGASVFVRDERADTALHLACVNAFSNVAQMLVEAGADPAVANAMGVTPLQIAQQQGDPDLVHVLTSPNLSLVVSDAFAPGTVTPYHSDMYALDGLDMYPMTKYGYNNPYSMDMYHGTMSPYSSRYSSSAYGPYAMDPYSRSAMDRYGLDRYWPTDHLALDRYTSSAFGRYGLIDSSYGPSSRYGRYGRDAAYMDAYSSYGMSPYGMRYGDASKYRAYGAAHYPAYGRYSMYDRMGMGYDPDAYYRARSMSSDWADDWYGTGAAYGYEDDYYNRHNYMGQYGTHRYGMYGGGAGAGAPWRTRGRVTSRERHRMRTYRGDELSEMIGAFVCRNMSHSERNRFMNRVERNAVRYRISASTLLSERYGADTLARMLVTDSSGHSRSDDLWATAEFIRSFRAGGSYAY